MSQYPEVELIQSQIGRPDDGTDPTGYYNAEFFVPLKPEKDWPKRPGTAGHPEALRGRTRRATKAELVEEMNAELDRNIIGVDWNFSQIHPRQRHGSRSRASRAITRSRSSGRTSTSWRSWPTRLRPALSSIPGITDVGVFRIKGQANLEMRDRPPDKLPAGASPFPTWRMSST